MMMSHQSIQIFCFPNSASCFTMSYIHHPGIMLSIGFSRIRLASFWFDGLRKCHPRLSEASRSGSKPSDSSQSSGIKEFAHYSYVYVCHVPCAVSCAVRTLINLFSGHFFEQFWTMQAVIAFSTACIELR